MSDTLYVKLTSPAGKVSYKPYVAPPTRLSDGMTEGEIISAVGGLAVCAMHGYHAMLPPHKFVAKRVEKVKAAVLEMFKGTGAQIDDAVITHVCNVWDSVMLMLDGETLQ